MIQRFAHYYAQHCTPYEVLFMQGLCSFRRHAWLTGFLYWLSRLGDGLLWWATGILFLCLGSLDTCRAVLIAAVAIAASIAVFGLMKRWANRPRPCEKWCDISSLVIPPDRFSLPSGHTMTAFSVYTVYAELIPGSGILFLPLAVLLGISRVFLGVHYPTDVLVGATLGLTIGQLAVWTLQPVLF